jgi:hypothetical protein
MRRRLVLLAVTLLAAIVASTAAAALRTHSIPGYGISVGLPSSWKTINYRDILKPGVLQTLARDNPDLAGSFAAMAQPNSPVKFFAYDPQAVNGFATNVNLVVLRVPGGITFADYSRRLVSELRNVSSVSNLHTAILRLPAGQAVRITYRLTIALKGRRLSVRTLQYGFLNRGRSMVFTYTTLPATASFYDAVFSASARSIRFS